VLHPPGESFFQLIWPLSVLWPVPPLKAMVFFILSVRATQRPCFDRIVFSSFPLFLLRHMPGSPILGRPVCFRKCSFSHFVSINLEAFLIHFSPFRWGRWLKSLVKSFYVPPSPLFERSPSPSDRPTISHQRALSTIAEIWSAKFWYFYKRCQDSCLS